MHDFRSLKTNPTMKIITAIDQKVHGLIQHQTMDGLYLILHLKQFRSVQATYSLSRESKIFFPSIYKYNERMITQSVYNVLLYLLPQKFNGRKSVRCYMAFSKQPYICIKCHVLMSASWIFLLLTPNKFNFYIQALLLLSKISSNLVGDPIKEERLYDAVECLLSFMV